MQNTSWTKDESQLLVSVVKQTELTKTTDWDAIALMFPGKTRQQCQIRFLKIINFNSSDSERYHDWTETEKQILFECVALYGKDWDRICRRFFQWLTPLKLKNKHYSLTKAAAARHESIANSSSSSTTQEAEPKTAVLDEEVLNEVRRILNAQ